MPEYTLGDISPYLLSEEYYLVRQLRFSMYSSSIPRGSARAQRRFNPTRPCAFMRTPAQTIPEFPPSPSNKSCPTEPQPDDLSRDLFPDPSEAVDDPFAVDADFSDQLGLTVAFDPVKFLLSHGGLIHISLHNIAEPVCRIVV